MPSPIKYIDLFAGLGGIRLGFTQAASELGLESECVFTSEIKPHALTAYNTNFPNENVEAVDITQKAALDIPKFKFLLGGFPCQAFSAAGAGKGLADSRGTLFFEIERILTAHLNNVDGFILENVEGLINHDKDKNDKDAKIGRTLSIILDILRNKLKFNTEYYLLDSLDFGIPQSRKRVYIVGCKKRFGKPKFNFASLPTATIADIQETGIEGLTSDFAQRLIKLFGTEELKGKCLKDKRGGDANIHSWDIEIKGKVSKAQKELLNILLKERRKRQWASVIGIDWMDGMPLTEQQISTFFQHPKLHEMLEDLVAKKYLVFEHPKKRISITTEDGHSYTQRIPDETKPKGYNIVTGKLSFEFSKILHPDGFAPTIVAMDMETLGIIDGENLRHLTLREGLRLFGYPENYSLEDFNSQGKIKLGYDLLGNTVCVPVIKAISKELLKRIYKL